MNKRQAKKKYKKWVEKNVKFDDVIFYPCYDSQIIFTGLDALPNIKFTTDKTHIASMQIKSGGK